tara:strand:- start:183 stop:482 length:300 start_codon:yes stop_codon:yes gene_type:complete
MERLSSTILMLCVAEKVMKQCGLTDKEITTTSADRFGISVMLDKGAKAFDFISKLTDKMDLTIVDQRAHRDEERDTEFFTTKFETPAGRSVDICLTESK